jgi:hypothetical protein
MKLTTEQRQVIADLVLEAHEASVAPSGDGYDTTAAAEAFVASLHDIEGGAPEWIARYVDALAVDGAKKVCADWRRANRLPGKTRKGTPVDMPAFAGVRRSDGGGAPVYVQMRFESMDIEALRMHRDKLEAARNTYSREITLISDLIDLMEADPSLRTAGDALAHLMAA